MKEKYICPCGLICFDCLFYRKDIYENAINLRNSIKTSQIDILLESIAKNETFNIMADHLNAEKEQFKKSFKPFSKFADFMDVLDGLIELQCKTTCKEADGCAVGGKTHACDAVKCVQERGYKGCWECPENEDCRKLCFVKKAYGETIKENFETMITKGSKDITSRGNKYYAWQRNNK